MRHTLLFVFCCWAPLFAQARFSFSEVKPGALELSDQGKPVYVYNHGMVLADGFPEAMKRSTYLHPVYLPDGRRITDDFNKDHPHHRGISWMWPVVTVGGKTYDLWTVGGIKQRFVRWTARETSGKRSRLAAVNGWYVDEQKVVDERIEIVAHPVEGGGRRLDFTLTLEASDSPVEIAGTPDGKKGFGGFCFRFSPRDGGAKATVIRTEKGVLPQDGVLAVASWAQVEGSFEGRPGGARVEDLPSNPGYPNGWLMRHGFGFLNPSYPGLNPVTVGKGKPLVLRYRVTLYSGQPPEK